MCVPQRYVISILYLFNSFEILYNRIFIRSQSNQVWLFFLFGYRAGDGIKAVFTETDLRDYPGLYLYNPTGRNQLKGSMLPTHS